MIEILIILVIIGCIFGRDKSNKYDYEDNDYDYRENQDQRDREDSKRAYESFRREIEERERKTKLRRMYYTGLVKDCKGAFQRITVQARSHSEAKAQLLGMGYEIKSIIPAHDEDIPGFY